MKMNKFFMGILGALALTACSSEEVIPDQNPLPGEGEPRYMSVSIRNANPGTRAGDQQKTSDGKIYEEGYNAENAIKSLRFYFFKADGSPAPVKYEGENFYDCKAEDLITPEEGPDQNLPNVEKILNAVIVIRSKTNEGSRDDIRQMVAIANYGNLSLGSGKAANKSLSELMNIVNNETQLNVGNATDGFVMTSSCFYDEEGYGCAVEIKEGDIKSTEDLAEKNPVDVYVERVVAKVRVKTNWDEDKMDKPVTVNFEGGEYEAIPLSSLVNGNKTPIYTTRDGQERIYVIFKEWDLWWTPNISYLFKKVGIDDSNNWKLDWNWNDKAFFRSYWAENPADDRGGVNFKLAKHPHNFVSKKIQTSISATEGADNYAQYSAYCLENAADPDNKGLKKSYSPTAETTNRTQVYLSAVLVTVDENNVAKRVSYAEWAGGKYTEDGVLAEMFSHKENIIYFRSKDPIGTSSSSSENPDGSTLIEGGNTYKMIPVTINDVKLVSGLEAGIANSTAEASARYLSYVNLNEKNLFGDKTIAGETYEVEPNALYRRDGDKYTKLVATDTQSIIDLANDSYEDVGGAKIWRDGNTYYYHDLHHLAPDTDAYDEKGRYGVVRNHIYEVEINTVYGLGTPVLTPKPGEDDETWEEIIPQKPSPEAYFLGARLNILSWRVVNNNVGLNWD